MHLEGARSTLQGMSFAHYVRHNALKCKLWLEDGRVELAVLEQALEGNGQDTEVKGHQKLDHEDITYNEKVCSL